MATVFCLICIFKQHFRKLAFAIKQFGKYGDIYYRLKNFYLFLLYIYIYIWINIPMNSEKAVLNKEAGPD